MSNRFLLVIAICTLPATAWGGFMEWWLTPDQQGHFSAAARHYTDPMRRGAAFYRAGDFEAAAASFGQATGATAAYNRGNALVMLGKYDQAIASFTQALEIEPGWQEAQENKLLAEQRRDRLKPPDSDAGGTGGKLAADKVVFDLKPESKGTDTQEQGDGGGGMSDQEVRAMWMRRLQTSPADFLKNKFAYQLSIRAAPEQETKP